MFKEFSETNMKLVHSRLLANMSTNKMKKVIKPVRNRMRVLDVKRQPRGKRKITTVLSTWPPRTTHWKVSVFK